MFCITLILVVLILTEQRSQFENRFLESDFSVGSSDSSDLISGNVVYSKAVNQISYYCEDSDDLGDGLGGKNFFTKGTYKYYTMISSNGNKRKSVDVIKTDYCDSTGKLNEYYCDIKTSKPKLNVTVCEKGCKDGACVGSPSVVASQSATSTSIKTTQDSVMNSATSACDNCTTNVVETYPKLSPSLSSCNLQVYWNSGPTSANASDWIAVYDSNALIPNNSKDFTASKKTWKYVTDTTSILYSQLENNGIINLDVTPLAYSECYNLVYYSSNSYNVKSVSKYCKLESSKECSVGITGSSATPDNKLMVNWKNPLGSNETDWIAIFDDQTKIPTNGVEWRALPQDKKRWLYLNGKTTAPTKTQGTEGSVTFSYDATTCWNIVYYKKNGYDIANVKSSCNSGIINKAPPCTDPDGSCIIFGKSITLLSPNGGEKLTPGSTYLIRWTSLNISETSQVFMQLSYVDLSGSRYEMGVFQDKIINSGEYKWRIPLDLKNVTGFTSWSDIKPDQFKLRIGYSDSSSSKVQAEDYSDEIFSILPRLCNDSDGGLNYDIRGQIQDGYSSGLINKGFDFCADDVNISGGRWHQGDLVEYVCRPYNWTDGSSSCSVPGGCIDYQAYKCPNGCLNGACVSKSYDLSQYPNLFIKNGLFNGVIVVGEKASTENVVAAINIQNSLNVRNGNAMLDKDVTTLNQNIISVGSPCSNTISSEIEGNPQNCADGLSPGTAKLKLYTQNGYAHLIVEGYSDSDLANIVKVLVNYKNYNLSGVEYSIKSKVSDCVDSDNGVNLFVQGTTTRTEYGNVIEQKTDTCIQRSPLSVGISNIPLIGSIYKTARDLIAPTPTPIKRCDSDSICLVTESVCNADNSITSYEDPCKYGCEYGACLNPSITILSPNGGETFTQSNPINIVWNSSLIVTANVFLVNIDYVPGYPGAIGVIGISPADSLIWDGKTVCQTWGPTGGNDCSTIGPGSYKIYVVGELADGTGRTVEDVSDSYFKIIPAASTCGNNICDNGEKDYVDGAPYYCLNDCYTQNDEFIKIPNNYSLTGSKFYLEFQIKPTVEYEGGLYYPSTEHVLVTLTGPSGDMVNYLTPITKAFCSLPYFASSTSSETECFRVSSIASGLPPGTYSYNIKLIEPKTGKYGWQINPKTFVVVSPRVTSQESSIIS